MPDLPPVGVIALPPIIVALVALAQRLGLPIQFAPWLNAFLSVGGYALVLYIAQRPEIQPVVENVLVALTIFLSAAGIYDRLGKPARALAGKTT